MLQPHPRRLPADHSVSLLHRPHKRLKRHHDSPGSERNPSDSPSDNCPPPIGHDGSGDSSNPEAWFESTNNHVRRRNPPVIDDEPPLFLRGSSSQDTPPLPAQRSHLYRESSSTADFRGVIDDLTVENKRLRRRLDEYERIHDSPLKDDRLFEVRMYGLPSHQKHELETALRNFTAGLTHPPADHFPSNGYQGLVLSRKQEANTDSAYASASASGQGSSSGVDGARRNQPFQSADSRQRNIQSYLHDIPEGLMPSRQPAMMTDGAKQRFVVRKLEQIFAGKGAAGDGHQQPIQQQEVSQSAAQADRSVLEASGQLARQEGIRESMIMDSEPVESGPAGQSPSHVSSGVSSGSRLPGVTQHQDFAEPASTSTALEQRPTRPLDLDLQRAQVPAENIRYMQHLGFSPLGAGSLRPPEDDHGWIYLNFLTNMAQLHTINVTAKFVRQAVGGFSEKLEVSPDGRKLRWKGGNGVTHLGSNDDGTAFATVCATADGSSPRKQVKVPHKYSSRSTVSTTRGVGQMSQHVRGGLAYTGLSHSHEGFSSAADGNSIARRHAGNQSPSTGKGAGNEDGPIVFYNNARFCTDLSGDRRPPNPANIPIYSALSIEPLGKPRDTAPDGSERRGPLYSAEYLNIPVNSDVMSTPRSQDLTMPTPSVARSPPDRVSTPPDMEVTGMGGIWPSDNLLIDVRTRPTKPTNTEVASSFGRAKPRALLPGILEALGRSDGTPVPKVVPKHRIVSTSRRELPPSQLPPTLDYMSFDGSCFDSDEEDDENTSDFEPLESPRSRSPLRCPARPTLEMPFDDMSDTSSAIDEEEDMADAESNSVDLLAAAREVDPEAVRQREREYDACMAERLAEEIPAGSSAATAGGWSGAGSPEDRLRHGDNRRATIAAPLRRTAAFKRMQSDESMISWEIEDCSTDEDDG